MYQQSRETATSTVLGTVLAMYVLRTTVIHDGRQSTNDSQSRETPTNTSKYYRYLGTFRIYY